MVELDAAFERGGLRNAMAWNVDRLESDAVEEGAFPDGVRILGDVDLAECGAFGEGLIADGPLERRIKSDRLEALARPTEVRGQGLNARVQH
jgi:hypothetical protein